MKMTRADNARRTGIIARESSTPKSTATKKCLVSVGMYKMLGLLGKGNFARVQEAVHTVLGVKVAVKILDTDRLSEDYVVKNLTREAKLLSMLRHPGIVRLYETIQCSTSYYIVMELAAGGDLFSHIKDQPTGKLEESTARHYCKQLVSALKHMHERGVVHRDLKTENIMFQDARKNQIKIVDFGLSNVCTSNNLLGTHCGSPEYAAPELFVVGKKYGPEVDLWSLGVVLYVMTTGQLPFMSPSNEQTSSDERRRRLMTQINMGLRSPQLQCIAKMSTRYKSLVCRLLVPAPSKRLTIKELCADPWVEDKQKSVGKHTAPILDEIDNRLIVQEISKVIQISPEAVQREIIQQQYGKIGGIYNIKAHTFYRDNSPVDISHQEESKPLRVSMDSRVRECRSTCSSRKKPPWLGGLANWNPRRTASRNSLPGEQKPRVHSTDAVRRTRFSTSVQRDSTKAGPVRSTELANERTSKSGSMGTGKRSMPLKVSPSLSRRPPSSPVVAYSTHDRPSYFKSSTTPRNPDDQWVQKKSSTLGQRRATLSTAERDQLKKMIPPVPARNHDVSQTDIVEQVSKISFQKLFRPFAPKAAHQIQETYLSIANNQAAVGKRRQSAIPQSNLNKMDTFSELASRGFSYRNLLKAFDKDRLSSNKTPRTMECDVRKADKSHGRSGFGNNTLHRWSSNRQRDSSQTKSYLICRNEGS